MRVLFVTHKWGDAVPNSGESVTIPHLIDTFCEWGGGDYAAVWTDECFHAGLDVVDLINRKVREFDPDAIIFTPIPNSALEDQNISPQAMRSFGKRTISVFFDLADAHARRMGKKYAAASDLSVNVDGCDKKIGRNFVSLWPARTKRPSKPKTIDVSFVGARGNYVDRTAVLNLLQEARIPIVLSGGRAETRCSFEEYFDILDRSLITLNFSKTVRGDSQIKARIFEALSCGCCLVEDHNDVTARYLEPGSEYLAWNNADELPGLIRSLLNDRGLATRIAETGKRKFEEQYSAACFWDRIQGALETKCSWFSPKDWLRRAF